MSELEDFLAGKHRGTTRCEWCGKELKWAWPHLTIALATVIRRCWGPVYCRQCSAFNHYAQALEDIRDDIQDNIRYRPGDRDSRHHDR